MFIFPVHVCQVGYSIIPDLLHLGVGVWGEVSKKFGCKSVDDKVDGLIIYSVVQVGSGGTPGMITDYSETFWLDNLECEVVGGECGPPDGGNIS